ncbi:MAG: DUF1517 domain-containing protein [Cyanobacteriota bacterium]|nr:DUF1517 domain-containing protein [Cyanobacteriota bacterium]
MLKKIWQSRWTKGLLALVLVIGLSFWPAHDGWARSGGRMGGGSFRAPRYSAPRTVSPRSGPAPVYGGGGFGFPLLMPFFWGGGGGGLLTLFLLLGVGSFLFRNWQGGALNSEEGSPNPQVQVSEIKVGLLASARQLQKEIDRLALEADTTTPEGLSRLLQDVSLSLTRHDDYWVYGQADSRSLNLSQAESFFYQQSMLERSKFSQETLSNVSAQLTQGSPTNLAKSDDLALADVGEYLVVTLLVAHQAGSGTLPVVDSAAALRRCLMQVGSTSADRLVAVEVLWTPQMEGDSLTSEQLLTEYPQLRRL